MAVHSAAGSCSAALDELSAAAAILIKESDSEKDGPRCLGRGAVECGGDVGEFELYSTSPHDKENDADLPRSSLLEASHKQISKAACTLPGMQRTPPFARMIRPCPCS